MLLFLAGLFLGATIGAVAMGALAGRHRAP
jgi:hypothetical protein